jgi:hypothetical protein
MKKTLLAVLAFLLGSAGIVGAWDSGFGNSPSIVSPNGRYFGRLNNNQYDPDSVANPYGQYGSRYSPDSINNPYGKYGSPYSPYSATNPYATQSPFVIGR